MLGYVHGGQPTVILRVFVNAWICTCQATERDLESFNVNAWTRAQSTTDRDLETKR